MVISARTDFKSLVTLSIRKKTYNTNSHPKAERQIKTDRFMCRILPKAALTYTVMEKSAPTATYSFGLKKKKVIYNSSKARRRFKAKFSLFFSQRSYYKS